MRKPMECFACPVNCEKPIADCSSKRARSRGSLTVHIARRIKKKANTSFRSRSPITRCPSFAQHLFYALPPPSSFSKRCTCTFFCSPLSPLVFHRTRRRGRKKSATHPPCRTQRPTLLRRIVRHTPSSLIFLLSPSTLLCCPVIRIHQRPKRPIRPMSHLLFLQRVMPRGFRRSGGGGDSLTLPCCLEGRRRGKWSRGRRESFSPLPATLVLYSLLLPPPLSPLGDIFIPPSRSLSSAHPPLSQRPILASPPLYDFFSAGAAHCYCAACVNQDGYGMRGGKKEKETLA